MTFRDFQHIQNYYVNDENRDPSMTEIRVLRYVLVRSLPSHHFSTELKDVEFGKATTGHP